MNENREFYFDHNGSGNSTSLYSCDFKLNFLDDAGVENIVGYKQKNMTLCSFNASMPIRKNSSHGNNEQLAKMDSWEQSWLLCNYHRMFRNQVLFVKDWGGELGLKLGLMSSSQVSLSNKTIICHFSCLKSLTHCFK